MMATHHSTVSKPADCSHQNELYCKVQSRIILTCPFRSLICNKCAVQVGDTDTWRGNTHGEQRHVGNLFTVPSICSKPKTALKNKFDKNQERVDFISIIE